MNTPAAIFLVILGAVSALYDVLLIVSSPGTALDNLTSFTHIWLVLGLVLIFLGIYRIRKKESFLKKLGPWQKRILALVTGAGLLVSIVSLAFILNPETADIDSPADYVILLGGGIDKNGVLPDSVMLRVEKTAEYMSRHKNCICVVSGGTLKWLPYPEAPELKRQLVLHGIDENRIFAEERALDTIQNFQLSVELLCNELNLSAEEVVSGKWIIVTSDYHLRRAQRLAARMGFTDIKGIACRTPPFRKLHNLVREIGAYIKLNARILFTGKPEPIA